MSFICLAENDNSQEALVYSGKKPVPNWEQFGGIAN